MTDKQRLFCDEYLLDLNATRAYKAVYTRIKSDDAARANASRLLTKANIKAYIDARLEEIRSSKIADAREVMEYLTKVLRGETLAEIVVVEGNGEGLGTSARRMDKAPDERERLKAAELLGKRYSLFTDKVQQEGNITITLMGEVGELSE